MRRVAIVFNLLYLVALVLAALGMSTPPADYYDPETGTPSADLTPPAVMAAWAFGIGAIAATPALLNLHALLTRRVWSVNLAYAFSLLGGVGCALLSVLGLVFWFPAYAARHFTDEGGAAGAIMMVVCVPIALVCAVNYFALRAIRQEPD